VSAVSFASGAGSGKRSFHPCTVTFLMWCAWAGCAVAAAAISHSALWLLLVLPALPTLYVLGSRIARGHPTTDLEAAQRLKQILAEVGGEQELAVMVQDQTASPCELRRGSHPRLIAALGFVKDSSDGVLRGVAALQHASLRTPQMNSRVRLVRVISLLAVFAVAVLAAKTAPRTAAPFAVFATIPLTSWLTGVLLSAWSTLDAAGYILVGLDAMAVDLAGNATPVIDALVAMDAWREANRAARPPLEKAVYRCIQPVLPSVHTAARVTRLRALAEAT
jgi:hypothetical protein